MSFKAYYVEIGFYTTQLSGWESMIDDSEL